MIGRRQFLKVTVGTSLSAGLGSRFTFRQHVRAHALAGGTLDPSLIPKYRNPLVIPPAMPPAAPDYYDIAVRQFLHQVLPAGPPDYLPETTVWSYGPVNDPGSVAEGGSFFYPAFTVEATWQRPTWVKWTNDLVDGDGNFLPHLLPVDQTLHWCNPARPVDRRWKDPEPYLGPVPIVTHLHGGHTTEESDGYPEAWFLPDARNIPRRFARGGTWYEPFRNKFFQEHGIPWSPGTSVFRYGNNQRATTLWYHDHALGITRLNVYAGPAGFYLLRGGPDDLPEGTLPGPAAAVGENPYGELFEVPVVIQDRSFNEDGSLFYPDNRAFFEGLARQQLQIPFIPEPACKGKSDVSPIWNPEFFGNTIVVNGQTWPYLEVQKRRYRFRFLNGCNSRFLILKMSNDHPVYQIGADGGFLAAPAKLNQLLLAPAERADVIVDFSTLPVGSEIILQNLGPDEPFGGGIPDIDFPASDPGTTGQVMQFRVVPSPGRDLSTPPMDLVLPIIASPGPADYVRAVSLNEKESETVRVSGNEYGDVVLNCRNGETFGPTEALLGRVNSDGKGEPLGWGEKITEDPRSGDTEVWEIHNFTEDAHPIHVHLVQFQVLEREVLQSTVELPGTIRPPDPWETGFKDTVIAFPGEIMRIKAKFDSPGLFVWHCHILEHEDNEMMRPYRII